MSEIEEKFQQRINEEAARWVEKELEKRMAHAREAIQEQVQISMPEVGPSTAGNHLNKALAFAEEQIRMELEFEAQTWVDEQLKTRKDPRQGESG